MAATTAAESPLPPPLTVDDIILLAENPSATLPSSFSTTDLLPLLHCPSLPLFSSLLSLLSRSAPSSNLVGPLLLSFLRHFFSRSLPSGRDSSRLIHLFFPVLSHLEHSNLPALLDLLSSHLLHITSDEDAQPLDLLPYLLSVANADGELISAFLDKLLSVEWSKALLIKVVSLIRDCPVISRARVSEFLQKIFAGMCDVDIQDLPSLVYQLLLLASKGISSLSRRELIAGLLKFFGKPMTGPASVVRQVERTVLMHVNFAVKQDPSLGQMLIAIVRSDLGAFNHFAAAILFSVARIRRFNDSSLGTLRSVVVVSHQDLKLASNCKWLPDSIKEEILQTAKRVEKAFVRAINESSCGREHVVPSILQFGFILLESVDGRNHEESDSTEGLVGIEMLGIQTIKTLFEVHEMARNQVVEQCKFRILSLKHQQSSPFIKMLGHLVQIFPNSMLEYVAHLKELLDYFIFMHEKTEISLIGAILPLIKFSNDLRDYIILVIRKAMFRHEDDVRTAAACAIIDLIIMENRSKRNGLNSLQESSSQASCSQQSGLFCSMGGSLFQELSGLLRRCITTQQIAVKEIVYKGLAKLVMLDPAIAGHVYDFLWTHFLLFYSQDSENPLRMDACYKMDNGKVSQTEPLDQLLSCVSWVLHPQQYGRSYHYSEYSLSCFGFTLSQENEASRASAANLFVNALSRIRKILSKWIFEGGLIQSEASSSHSLVAEKSCVHGCLLLGILEVFINVAAFEMEKAVHDEEEVLEKEIMCLIDSYNYVEKESGLNKLGFSIRKGLSNTVVQHKSDRKLEDSPLTSQLKLFPVRRTLLATSSIHKLLILAVNSYNASSYTDQTTQNHTESSLSKTMGQCMKLISFSLKVCLQHLRSITSIDGELIGDPFKTVMYGDFKQLAQPIMQLVWLHKVGPKAENGTKKKEAKGKKNFENKGNPFLLALLCLKELFRIIPSKACLPELIDTLAASNLDLGNTVDDAERMNQEEALMVDDPYVMRLHAFLDKIVKPLYTGRISISLFHEAEIVSELLLIIWRILPFAQRKHHGVWMMNLCKNKMIENPKSAQNLVTLSLYLMPATNDLSTAKDIASELLQVMGSEEKAPIDISKKYPFVNHSTRDAVAAALLQLMESCFVDLDWSVSKLKAICNLKHDFDLSLRNHQFAERLPGVIFEEAVHSRAEALVHVLSFFAEMNLKDSLAEQFLKLTARFYKLLVRMTKLCIAPKGCKQQLPGNFFQKLAEVACRNLTSTLYNFVALVQRNQQEYAQSRGIINKIKRENRCIPDLIFQIEDYERYLIQLSKKTKVNLIRNAKRSTARDFKILEKKKAAPVVEEAEHDPAQPSSDSSGNESGDQLEGPIEDNISEKAASPESIGEDFALKDSDCDDKMDAPISRRVKMCKVVYESEDEAS